MNVRFHTDPDGSPHIHKHNIQTFEVIEALDRRFETLRGSNESYVTIGQTRSGRYLKVVYARARDGDGIFVITAYDLTAKQLRAFKRRKRRRGS